MGLTNSVMLPWHRDDPHGAFDGGDVNTVPAALKDVFDGFMNDLTSKLDSVTQQPLTDDTVITINGDTSKDPGPRPGWGDGTPNNTNLVYVYSAATSSRAGSAAWPPTATRSGLRRYRHARDVQRDHARRSTRLSVDRVRDREARRPCDPELHRRCGFTFSVAPKDM